MDIQDLIGSEQVYDLSQPLFNGAPTWGGHAPYQVSFGVRHGDNVLADGYSSASEILHLSSHSGTHIDALSHVSDAGTARRRACARRRHHCPPTARLLAPLPTTDHA
ncbi:MAG: cyclase family protein [Chloroflexi bacterium]|nr:cyclase family protein [Chloroflexota bacterium]